MILVPLIILRQLNRSIQVLVAGNLELEVV
jgi:hypothetical protein